MLTFLVADDHSIVRSGLKIIINNSYPDAIFMEASNFIEIDQALSITTVNILILDISFPEGNTLNIISNIKTKSPNIKILIFSSYDEEIYAMRYFKAGADGYLSKLSTTEEIENAISTLIKQGRYASPKIKDKIIDIFMHNKPENPLDELSDREMEIATLMVNGLGNLEISNILSLKATTVSTYKNRIFEKLSITNVSALIQIFNLHDDQL